MYKMQWIAVIMAAGMLSGCTTPGPSPANTAWTDSAAASAVPAPGKPAGTQSADAAPPDPEPANAPATQLSQFTSTPVADLPQCARYSVTATVDGKVQPLNGEACRQPDGSWHIAEQPAGGTTVYQTVYWPPADASVYDDACFDTVFGYPCLYDFPFAFSIGFPVFIDVRHRFHPFLFHGAFHHFGPAGHLGPVDHFTHFGGFGHGGFAHGGFPGGGFGHAGGFPGGFHGR